MTGEGAAFAFDALHLEPSTVALQSVLDDGETQSRATLPSRASRIDSVEALSQPRDVLRGYSMPLSMTEK